MQKRKENPNDRPSRQPSDKRSERKERDDSRMIKAVAVGCMSAVAVGLLLCCILSMVMSSGKIPIWMVNGVGLALCCVMAAAAAFFCARVSRQNGFFLGLLCSGILFLICMLCSLAVGEGIGFWGLIKLFAMLICGCVFGSVGVNVKGKR